MPLSAGRRLVVAILLLVIVCVLAFSQLVVAISRWYDWELSWLAPYREWSCAVKLFCERGFVPYFLFALVAMLFAGILFGVAQRLAGITITPSLTVREGMVIGELPSKSVAVLLGAVSAVQVVIVGFLASGSLPPAAIWAFGLLLAFITFGWWEYQLSGRTLLSRSEVLYVIGLTSILLGGAFLGAQREVWGLACLVGGAAGVVWSWLVGRHSQSDLWTPNAKVVLLGLAMLMFLLGAYRINAWRFAVVGDEWAFYLTAVRLVEGRLGQKPLLTGVGNYNIHPLLSSYIQSLSMQLFGVDNYGWRISNVLLTAWGILPLYVLVRGFASERMGLLAAGFYGASHYLMAFGKIGYNNLQALWPLLTALALWLLAARRQSLYGMWCAGAVAGLGFYVFALGRLTFPLLLLLLLVYCFPRTRYKRWCWLAVGLGFLVAALPILIEGGSAESLLKQTVFHELGSRSREVVLAQVRDNFLRALFSFISSRKHTHFVFGAHLGPLTSSLMVLGVAVLLCQIRRNVLPTLLLLAWVGGAGLFGAVTQYDYPPNTRMFMLLPLYAILASIGADAVLRLVVRSTGWRMPAIALAVLFVLAGFALNTYIAYDIYPEQRALTQECLLVRRLQLMEQDQIPTQPTYVIRSAGDRYDLVSFLLHAYDLEAATVGVVTPEQFTTLMREQECGQGQAIFLFPSQIAGLDEALGVRKASCPAGRVASVLDPSGAYHYHRFDLPLTVPSDVGHRVRMWQP